MPIKDPGRAAGVAASLALLVACGGGPKSSSTSGPGGGPVPTNRMSLFLTVESEDLRTVVVRANLNDGRVAGSSYRLDGGDYLRACVNAICRNLHDNDSVFTPDYIARFDFQSGVDYVVSFNRLEAASATNSRVALPAAFSLVTPAAGQQVTDGDTVIVSWTPAGAPASASLSYDAECTMAAGSPVFSSGSLGSDTNRDGQQPFEIDEIVDAIGRVSPLRIVRCSIDLTVSHELEGRVDPAFGDGTALGIVSRTVDLDYIPR
jgi:hypothetical protein